MYRRQKPSARYGDDFATMATVLQCQPCIHHAEPGPDNEHPGIRIDWSVLGRAEPYGSRQIRRGLAVVAGGKDGCVANDAAANAELHLDTDG